MNAREILKLEELCIQDELPACNAACPVHVDVRSMMASMSAGDFDAARKQFEDRIPFPAIISRVCDHPCQNACKRREAGEAIRISWLERACMEWGKPRAEKSRRFPARKERIAIVGGGLSGISAALELVKKGYQVAVYEKSERLGGGMWHLPAEQLPREIIAEEFARAAEAGFTWQADCELGHTIDWDELTSAFSAVYLAPGRAEVLTSAGIDVGAIDPLTLATNRSGVFAGGSLRLPAGTRSPILSVADGQRAALSIDRYLKKVSLQANREKEGRLETRLYTNTDRWEVQPSIAPADPERGYTAEEARQEAQRCPQCNCLECVRVCPFLEHYQSYPRSYIREISKTLIVLPGLGVRTAADFINTCSLCGLCAEVCPNQLDMGLICHEARRILVDNNDMAPAVHNFAIRDMLSSNSDDFTLFRHQPGYKGSRYLFFPGCQLSASMPEEVFLTYNYLSAGLSGGVGLGLGCCGAPADWAGRQESFSGQIAQFKDKWEGMGRPIVITACSSCYQILQMNLPELPLESLWGILEEIGLPPAAAGGEARRVAVHDPCRSRHQSHVHEQIRRILANLEVEIEELPLNRQETTCCGYGGLMSLINSEVAAEVADQRIASSKEPFLVYCSNCRDHFAARGKETWHILDLIWGNNNLNDARRKGPNHSLRRENRRHLKNKFLAEVWRENVIEESGYRTVKLVMEPPLGELLEERYILAEDVQQVIYEAESSGRKLQNLDNGHYTAHMQLGIMTYWVEYLPEGDFFRVFNAYSHRMQLIEDVNRDE